MSEAGERARLLARNLTEQQWRQRTARWVLHRRMGRTPFRVFLFGVLKQFDLPEVAALVAPRPLLLLNPVDQEGRRAEAAPLQARYPTAQVRAGVSVTAATYLEWMGPS